MANRILVGGVLVVLVSACGVRHYRLQVAGRSDLLTPPKRSGEAVSSREAHRRGTTLTVESNVTAGRPPTTSSNVEPAAGALYLRFLEGECQIEGKLRRLQAPDRQTTLGEALTQVCLHSHGHRAQCATRLRMLGGRTATNGLHSMGERSTASGLALSAVHRDSRVMSRSVNHPRHGPNGTPLAGL